MKQIARQLIFLLIGTLFRYPVWAVLWVLGRFGLFKVVFLVYPADVVESQGFCPTLPVTKRFFSGRPTIGGFIVDGARPIGIYLVVPDTVQELASRANNALAHTIVDKLFRIARLVGAKSIGLAGQLSFIFEKKHRIPITAPLYSSLFGSVFSLSETIDKVIRLHFAGKMGQRKGKTPVIGILGRGEISELLARHIEDTHSVHPVFIDVKYLKDRRIALKNENKAIPHLNTLDLLVNMMPTGDHFFQTQCDQHLSDRCIIIDFSHPAILAGRLPHQKHAGNRIQRNGLRFIPSLPGEWQRHTLPACSLASLLASEQDPEWNSFETFCSLAKARGFFVPFKKGNVDPPDPQNHKGP